MENESKLPKRKHPRLDSYDYSTAGAYFITICAKDRRCIFSDVVWRNESIVGRCLGAAAVNPASTDRNEAIVGGGRGYAKRYPTPAATPAANPAVNPASTDRNEHASVGRGLAPAAVNPASTDRDEYVSVGRCLGAAAVTLTPFGEIAKEQLLLLENRYPHLSVDQYVIMPNHIHVIFVLRSDAAKGKDRCGGSCGGSKPPPYGDQNLGDVAHSRDAAGVGNALRNPCPRPTVTEIVCAYKSLTTRECKKSGFSLGQVFQTSFYDHVIRDRRDYEEHLKYIAENPMRWAYDELYSET